MINLSHSIPIAQGNLAYHICGKGDPLILLHGGPGMDSTYLMPELLKLAEHHPYFIIAFFFIFDTFKA